ncbi:hypothetical protein [Edaphobacter albus]|uniref:hypothetical protein n=1 Tax=Edaphobacter sp. 4G125 TaxID=2763071 RepID=UPI0016445058|nr:hypothetical protein [Edaphobacter sp. 4G125]QNI36885.1 hypothetical protein H7846_00630 [Edaphobacter sp. 4G125]
MSVYRFLSSSAVLLAFTVSVAVASEPTSDFPGASDFHVLTRPTNSFIIGARHIDNDEYAIPLGPVESNSKELGKSTTVTGPIDVLAYAGPKTASSLTTYTTLTSQLTAAGYTEVWSCARKTCGSGYSLATILSQPTIDSIHVGNWASWMIDSLDATNDDVRYGTFHKGNEYMLVMGALSPGYPSGALVIRVNGPATESVLQEASANADADSSRTAAPAASTPATQSNPAAASDKVKSKARSIWNQIPR